MVFKGTQFSPHGGGRPQPGKEHLKKGRADVIFTGSQILCPQDQERERMFPSLLLDVAFDNIGQGKETKGIPLGKEEVKLSLLTGDCDTCMRNPKEYAKAEH